jgi:hypothetical protein
MELVVRETFVGSHLDAVVGDWSSEGLKNEVL